MSNINTSDLNALKKSNEQSIVDDKLFTTEERMDLLFCINKRIVSLQIDNAFDGEVKQRLESIKEKIITSK